MGSRRETIMEKSYILQEIRRTAADNGGKPLGWRRFTAETGIKESDWKEYWPRWSAAIQELGLAPNQLTEAYERGELLESLAMLAVELGRLPTNADLRFKARRTPGFPSESIFARIGRRVELLAMLAEHCRSRSNYEAVVRWCSEYKPRSDDTPDESGPILEPEFGFVYLMKSGRFHKIGKSNAAGRRERELSIQLPERATTVHVIHTDDPGGIEAYWHKRFEAKRKNGEWFDLDRADIAAFKRRKFM